MKGNVVGFGINPFPGKELLDMIPQAFRGKAQIKNMAVGGSVARNLHQLSVALLFYGLKEIQVVHKALVPYGGDLP